MSKKQLYLLLFIDLLIITAAISFMVWHSIYKKELQVFKSYENRKPPQKQVEKQPAASEPAVSVQEPAKIEPPAVEPAPVSTTRKILFTYRNSRPSTVSVLGEFNSWHPAKMIKGANHVWSATLELEQGDYLYGYLVDEKFINDPNNPRTKLDVRGRKCSILHVKPLE